MHIAFTEWLAALLEVDTTKSAKQKSSEEDLCTICMVEYETHDNIMTLKCKHHFHTECIQKWFKTGNSECPLCR